MATETSQAQSATINPSLFDSEETFFGIKPDEGVESYFSKPANLTEDKKPDETKKDEKKIEEKEEFTFFDDKKKPDEEIKKSEEKDNSKDDITEDNKETEQDEDEDKFYPTLVKELKEKNIFRDFEVSEDQVIDEETLYSALDSEANTRADEIIETLVEGMSETAKSFLSFLKAGGSEKEFFEVYSNSSVPELDMSKPSDQELAVRQYTQKVLKITDPEEINDSVEFMKERGTLERNAKKFYEKIKEEEEANKQQLLEDQKKNLDQRKKSDELFVTDLKTTLDKIETIGDFSFAKVNKKELLDYVVKPSIKVGKSNFITPLQQKMAQLYQDKDKSKLLLLAKILQDDFNVKDAIAKTASEAVKKNVDKLRSAKGISQSVKNPYKGKSIVEMF